MTGAGKNTVSISLFNRGLAGKIFSEVKKTGAKVVMKNNTPECVLLSPDEYERIMEKLEDDSLIALAAERLANFDRAALIPAEDVYRDLGITQEDLENCGDVEIE
ncbi:MAG: type II toxin-antitoxin system Phd/YefM family antitoxin [Clostridia bacterium]|nr:type II toxin-antitoxin system Phd/YefM family antitoxin [Clostridia bacterium]